ncbi:hypothetical protein [Nocardioides sp. zg-1230]|uniref:hypothetical protein n=1 Tax=Nocardioides sp. zg-1230 TaxID=2736601 RepID=UPI001551BB25|nr:hypothetical protein [Nocardioides sp. zg-1230]NPC42946.1 hypothetical protein [Nocardioides sp. zg-1230]
MNDQPYPPADTTTAPTQPPADVPVAGQQAAPPPPAKPVFAPGKSPSGGADWRKIVVPLVAALVAVLAVWAYTAAPEGGAFADARSDIESMDDANNARTEGAPQQEVVNGWTTIEYLNLLSTQQEHDNDRRDMLLLLMLLSGLTAFTYTQAQRRAGREDDEPGDAHR